MVTEDNFIIQCIMVCVLFCVDETQINFLEITHDTHCFFIVFKSISCKLFFAHVEAQTNEIKAQYKDNGNNLTKCNSLLITRTPFDNKISIPFPNILQIGMILIFNFFLLVWKFKIEWLMSYIGILQLVRDIDQLNNFISDNTNW